MKKNDSSRGRGEARVSVLQEEEHLSRFHLGQETKKIVDKICISSGRFPKLHSLFLFFHHNDMWGSSVSHTIILPCSSSSSVSLFPQIPSPWPSVPNPADALLLSPRRRCSVARPLQSPTRPPPHARSRPPPCTRAGRSPRLLPRPHELAAALPPSPEHGAAPHPSARALAARFGREEAAGH